MQRSSGYMTTPDHTRLYFETLGTGADIVVIPNGIYLTDDLARLGEARTLIFYDPRNRGRSDAAEGGGILQDVEDLRAIVQHFAAKPVDVVAHSFAGLLAALFAKTCTDLVRRVVQIGPLAMNPDREFPPSLTNRDETFAGVMRELGMLLPQRGMFDPVVFCEKVWGVLRALYVTSRADAHRIRWSRCSLENERNGMRYFNEVTLPSIRALALTAEDFRRVKAPVLVVHGAKDRSAPYGGGREWAAILPDARLITVDEGGHAPWIEAPDAVLPAIETFLSGTWPHHAEQVASPLT